MDKRLYKLSLFLISSGVAVILMIIAAFSFILYLLV